MTRDNAATRRARRGGLLLGVLMVGVWAAVAALAGAPVQAADQPVGFTPTDPPNAPMGEAKGIHPGRVVWVCNPDITSWNGTDGVWWDDANLNPDLVGAALSESLRELTGEKTDAAAWDALFKHFNKTHGRGDGGYQKGEKVAVKINLNNSGYKWSGNASNASPQMCLALLRQLVREAKVDADAITFYDASRLIGDPIFDRCRAEFPAVRFVDRQGENGRIKAEPDKGVALHFGDPTLQDNGATYLPRCAVEATYLINLALLKGHNVAGVTLNAKNHFGSVWRERDAKQWNAGWSPGNMHCSVSVHGWQECPAGRPMGSYNALVDLMGHQQLGGKTLLFLIEGFYAAPHQGAVPARWQSAPFNGDWTSSLFASQDGVAIESVALDFMTAEPTLKEYVYGTVDNYLHEAAQANGPPSKTRYDPEGDGTSLGSLGVHEHWNSAADRRYSRNLGTGKGIELVPRSMVQKAPPQP